MSRGGVSYFGQRGCVNQEGERCMQLGKFSENPGPGLAQCVHNRKQLQSHMYALVSPGKAGRTGHQGPYRQHEHWHDSQAISQKVPMFV